MSEGDELLDIEQAARFLNVSETSLRRWTNAGWLACFRVGRRRERRFRRADLLGFMEDQPTVSQAGAARSGSPHAAHTVIDGVAYDVGAHLCGLFASEVGRIKQAISFLEDGIARGRCASTCPRLNRGPISWLISRRAVHPCVPMLPPGGWSSLNTSPRQRASWSIGIPGCALPWALVPIPSGS